MKSAFRYLLPKFRDKIVFELPIWYPWFDKPFQVSFTSL
ncbi:hypothetical protein CSE_14930 [Caldisericum exile AZM16c01]|uniref:Uncharacterized protein n=1 Tax=Caldisericum exile (strain DSM 21853 / NBRC 104410 / AZM16c01) TaxID=511051 RepID=A0A7U6JGE9_CALEA|nr:hypothetical protein CSE_14930 [Caldisericum exile AZM16c01]